MCYELILQYKYAIIPLHKHLHILNINILISREHWLQKDHYPIKRRNKKQVV